MNYEVTMIRQMIADGVIPQEVVEKYFPELKESEDEEIREALLEHIKGIESWEYFLGISKEQMIAWLEKQSDASRTYELGFTEGQRIERKRWLEKQGEQKPNPYSGTSFEYNGHTWGMCARDGGVEILLDGELKAFLSLEKSFIYPIHPQPELAPKSAMEAVKEEKVDNQNCLKPADKVEPKFKVGNWYQCTKDFFGKGVTFDKNTAYYCAKEGCLQNEYGCHIAIVKDLYDNFKLWTIQDAKAGDVLASKDRGDILIFRNIEDNLSFSSYYNIEGKNEHYWAKSCFIPATKEQRDLLFQKMHEAGYEWDAEKKEPKEIEKKPAEWSEEDETVIDNLVWAIANDRIRPQDRNDYCDWLKSLKSRVQPQPMQEWSALDERNLQGVIDEIQANKNKAPDYDLDTYDRFLNWLKSLRPQNHWKPSEEQMKVLDAAVMHSHLTTAEYDGLVKLREQLKKLSEE